MGAPLAVAVAFKEVGIVAAALLAATVVLAPAARVRALAMAGALVLTPVLLVAEIWHTSQFAPIRHHLALAAAGLVVVLAALAVLAWAFDRRPWLFPLAAVLVLPFRVPIESGGQTANLLVPLYFVVAAGAAAFVVRRLRADAGELESPPRGALEWVLLGFVTLYAIQASYSADFTKALEQVVFFYVPFALLYALLLEVPWSRRLVARCLWVLVGLGLVFSLVGFVEYATRTVFLNPDVVASNQFQTYFRVNSLFFDPNIFGRFLMLVMTALAATMLWSQRPRTIVAASAATAVLFGGLVLTLSQSSLGRSRRWGRSPWWRRASRSPSPARCTSS
jgi:putative inorganic carbon (HCO3(-)) transporter